MATKPGLGAQLPNESMRVYGIYLGLQRLPISWLEGLLMYYNGTWILWAHHGVEALSFETKLGADGYAFACRSNVCAVGVSFFTKIMLPYF